MTLLQTPRLKLRRIIAEDAEFLLHLLTDPSFTRFVGDRGIRTVDAARAYIETGPWTRYERHGFGMFLTTLADDTPIGICGLVQRERLPHPDIGFALMPAYWSAGYAREAAERVLDYARNTLELARVLAIVDGENAPSVALLEKLGLRHEGYFEIPGGRPPLHLFGRDL
jgi:RimJ/RimL family protein N-acetyltransferase